jgi:hypothetical protein
MRKMSSRNKVLSLHAKTVVDYRPEAYVSEDIRRMPRVRKGQIH